jgi:hypothetical protein
MSVAVNYYSAKLQDACALIARLFTDVPFVEHTLDNIGMMLDPATGRIVYSTLVDEKQYVRSYPSDNPDMLYQYHLWANMLFGSPDINSGYFGAQQGKRYSLMEKPLASRPMMLYYAARLLEEGNLLKEQLGILYERAALFDGSVTIIHPDWSAPMARAANATPTEFLQACIRTGEGDVIYIEMLDVPYFQDLCTVMNQ